MTTRRSSLSALLDKGSPVAGVDTFQPTGNFTAPGYTPSGGNTMDFRQGQMTPATQQQYQMGGMVTPQGPQLGAAQQGASPNLGVQDVQGEIERLKQENPEVIQQIAQVVMQGIQSGELTMQELNMAVQLATAAMQNPAMWPKLREMAIQQGLAEEQEVPMQYDAGLAASIIIAGQSVQGMQAPTGAAPAAAGQPPEASMAMGGKLPENSKNSDGSIPIIAHEGEYVIPKEVVLRKGTEFFDKLVGKGEKTKA
jgi:hypothetical protein